MIKILVSNITTIENCPADVIAVAKKTLTIKNPAYERVARITGSPWAAQRDFKYYKSIGNSLSFPRGFTKRFTDYLDKNKIEYEVEKNLVTNKVKSFAKFAPVKLRDYQEPLVQAIIDNDCGVIAAGTGTGKTLICLEAARRLGLKTLVLVPTTVIQRQFKDECLKWWKYEPGIIGDGEKTIGDITISTWQSLSADKELCEELAKTTSYLFIDECHGAISDERAKILKKFNPLKLIGGSGSPRRSKDDGKTEAIFFYLGEVIAKHMMPQVKPKVEVIRTGAKIPITANYHEMIDTLIEDDSRNKLIVGLAVGEAMSGHQVIILTKRVAHCERLLGLLPDWGDLIYHADVRKKENGEVLLQMRSQERDFKILLGTFSLLSAGLDIPSLDCLIMAGEIKSDVSVQQSAGRVLRLFEGKESATIYDLFDSDNAILRRQGYERQNFYKTQSWEVKT